ncbi:MAG: Asp23/Gls24 family envelope stress response protein [Lactobacillaceae bacterium]|jgi:uncharacterized alkaline shock family protein YloU|nr:Asp23/Gls24 family envelope stress response protein [Lactobacillaceae bacterium]
MALSMKTNNGNLSIDDDVVVTVIGVAATESFGVVGMVSKTLTSTAFEILNRQDFSKGITIQHDGDMLIVDVHIVVSSGVKLTEVAKTVQKQVSYALEKNLGITMKKVNVYIDGVRS